MKSRPFTPQRYLLILLAWLPGLAAGDMDPRYARSSWHYLPPDIYRTLDDPADRWVYRMAQEMTFGIAAIDERTADRHWRAAMQAGACLVLRGERAWAQRVMRASLRDRDRLERWLLLDARNIDRFRADETICNASPVLRVEIPALMPSPAS